MRYILDDNGYIEEVAFGATISCNNKSCTEYIGTIPDGYSTLLEWAENANIRAYKIVNKNLTYDSAKDAELTALYEQEAENNTLASRGWVNDKIEEVTSQSGHTHSNKAVLDGITSAKVSSWDNKAEVSAIPTKTSALTNDSGFLTTVPSEYITETELSSKGYLTAVPSEYVTESELTAKGYLTSIPSEYVTESELTAKKYLTSYTETDPVFKASVAAGITSANITNWNNKSNFSGNYNDLTNKPTIPTVPTTLSSFTNDVGYLTNVPSEYITELELSMKGYLTEHQELKTINGQSLVGTGNIDISSGGSAITPVTTIDGNSTDTDIPSAKAVYTYVGERVNDANAKKAISLSGVNGSSNYDCFYFPATGMVWFSMYATGLTTSASSRTIIATVPEGYRPPRRTALATDELQDPTANIKASISTTGEIGLLTGVAKSSGDDQYISGWWNVA